MQLLARRFQGWAGAPQRPTGRESHTHTLMLCKEIAIISRDDRLGKF
jgi:hypothetical protein